MARRFLLLMVLVVLLCSCATAPRPRNIVTSFHFDSDYDRAWSAVIETMAELNLPIDNLEKDSGLISTDWMTLGYGSTICDCGGAGLAIEKDRRGKFNIFVKVDPAGGTQIKVNTTFQVLREFMDAVSWSPCVSTGELEGKIKASVGQKLGVPVP